MQQTPMKTLCALFVCLLLVAVCASQPKHQASGKQPETQNQITIPPQPPTSDEIARQALAQPFIWATGLEGTTVVDTSRGHRPLEQYELTQVYSQWRLYIEYMASTGVTAVRWAVPWYRVEPAPGQFDWAWTDQVMNYLRDKNLDPIIDLTHYGSPAWLPESFADAAYPAAMAAFGAAFAQRYPWITKYVSFNEPKVAAEFGALRSVWPPYLQGDPGYVRILVNLAQGMQETVRSVRSVRPDALFIHVAPSTMRNDLSADTFLHALLPWDLVNGRVTVDHPLRAWLKGHGVTEDRLNELQANAVNEDIFGVNFYPWNTKGNQAPKKVLVSNTGDQLVATLKAIYEYTRVPLFITETGAWGPYGLRSSWMEHSTRGVQAARGQGIPVIGYTWYPALDMVGWEYRTNRKSPQKNIMHMGLFEGNFDATGKFVTFETPLAAQYRARIKNGIW